MAVPPNRDIIVVGGSAGAVEATRALAAALPADLPAAVFVVVHRGPQEPQLLGRILDAAGPLPAVEAEEGMRFERGRIYVAPPDRHLLVARDHLHVRRGPRENRMRPGVDPLFRSAAVGCSTRVIAVVLTGMLDDGTAGLRAVKRCGGLALVQDPAGAAYDQMPRSAIEHAPVDHVRPLAGIAPLLAELAAQPRPPLLEAPDDIRFEAVIASQELGDMQGYPPNGTLSPLTCPECHGVMAEIRDGGLIRYRCHTGHALTLEAMRQEQAEAWERALYNALRAQREQAMLARHMAADARGRGRASLAGDLERRASSYDEGAEIVRQLLARGGAAAGDMPPPPPDGEAA